MIQVKNYINITFKLQQLVFTKHFSAVAWKLQLPNLNPKRTLITAQLLLIDFIYLFIYHTFSFFLSKLYIFID